MYLSGLEIQQATGGQWLGHMPECIEYIQSDTRDFEQGAAFIALRGPHFDGHTFATQIAHKASALIGDHQGIQCWTDLDVPQLKVPDTLHALGAAAQAWRKKLKHTTVIAISGSYGKTTVRSMLAHTFHALDIKTTATRANLNNLIGVPMTLLSIAEDTDVALIECGISEMGEMQRLSEIVQPDIAILTGITSAHAEGLGGLDGVAREKAMLFKHLSPQGWCALAKGVDEQLQNTPPHCMQTSVGYHMQGSQLTLNLADKQATLTLSLPAPHWGANMAFVSAIVLQYAQQQHLDISLDNIADSLATWQPVDGRLQTIAGIHGCSILDDSYNANPISMQAALHTLAAMPARRIAILGDMAELGADAEHAHKQLDVSQVDMLMLVGTHMRALHKEYPTSQWFTDTDSLLAWLSDHQAMFTAQDTILIKASHGMQLDQVATLLTEQELTHVI